MKFLAPEEKMSNFRKSKVPKFYTNFAYKNQNSESKNLFIQQFLSKTHSPNARRSSRSFPSKPLLSLSQNCSLFFTADCLQKKRQTANIKKITSYAQRLRLLVA